MTLVVIITPAALPANSSSNSSSTVCVAAIRDGDEAWLEAHTVGERTEGGGGGGEWGSGDNNLMNVASIRALSLLHMYIHYGWGGGHISH